MNEYPVIKQGDQELAWVELRVQMGMCNTDDDISRNIESCLKRNYTRLQDVLNTESGAVSVVGSGPSLKENWTELRDSDTDIMACNGAFKFLLDKGIVPKFMFCFDADPLANDFITPHPDTTFLIGSRCPPEAFDKLEGCKIVAWHAGGDKSINDLLMKYGKMEPMVAGGTAAVTRAMMLAPLLGYREMHLWGCDSSKVNGETHIKKQTAPEGDMHIMVSNRAFKCSPWMAQQAEDFKILAPPLRDNYGVKIIVHGDGLIPWLAKIMGFDVDGEKKSKQVWRQFKHKSRILWQNL